MPKKITVFDRTVCRSFGDELQKVAEKLGKEFGLTVQLKGSRFTMNSYEPKLSFHVSVVDGESGNVVSKRDLENFKMMAPMYTIDPEAFGKSFVSRGKKLTVCGWNPKARTCPIICSDESGARYKVSLEAIQLRFPLAQATPTKQKKEKLSVGGQFKIGTISEEEAKKITPNYVAYTKGNIKFVGQFDLEDKELRKGMLVLVADKKLSRGKINVTYKIVKISSVGVDRSGERNSKVRVTDNEVSWRIDNCAILDSTGKSAMPPKFSDSEIRAALKGLTRAQAKKKLEEWKVTKKISTAEFLSYSAAYCARNKS